MKSLHFNLTQETIRDIVLENRSMMVLEGRVQSGLKYTGDVTKIGNDLLKLFSVVQSITIANPLNF